MRHLQFAPGCLAPGLPPIAMISLVLACFFGAGPSAAAPAAPSAPSRGCMTNTLALTEALEPVIEAVTDGRPDRVPAAARRAQTWWAAHRSGFAQPVAIDSAMRELGALATSHRAPLAARAALIASTAALDDCTDPPTVASRLMRIDLAGMAGWLRAHGVSAPFPGGVVESAQTIGARLRSRGRETMANGLHREVTATLAIPVGVAGNIRAANALLQRVDDIELALR